MSFVSPFVGARDGYPSVYVGPYSREGNVPWSNEAAPASAIWIATNRAIYVPIIVPRACVIRRFWWLNGATVGTNNLQAGLYDDTFASVLLGTSTLSAGTASQVQYDDVTDTPIGSGKYWLALWCNGTTATVFRGNPTNALRLGVFYAQSSLAAGLPSTATPASPTTFLPVFGFTTRATP